MLEKKTTLFIADLHLDESNPSLNQAFEVFIKQHAIHAQALYILGDFFNYWIGDDVMTTWHHYIARLLSTLRAEGTDVYLMVGNRDFLLGQQFARLADCQIIPDPWIINLDGNATLLKHGDDLCTQDKRHQLFRRISRNAMIKKVYLSLPKHWRLAVANHLRRVSKHHTKRQPLKLLDAVDDEIVTVMNTLHVNTLIHGHIHKPQLHYFKHNNQLQRRLVLGDWGDKSIYLCYDMTKGFKFEHI